MCTLPTPRADSTQVRVQESESDASFGNSEDDDEYQREEDRGETITIPFLSKGFDWSKFVTTTSDPYIHVSPYYIPEVGNIEEKYVVARCKYLNTDLTNENKQQVKDILETHQHDMKKSLKSWIQQYWVELCKHLGIKFGDGFDVTTYQELQAAVRQCKSLGVAKKIVTCLYLSFDFCGNYRKKIGRCLLQQYSLILDERCNTDTKVSICDVRKSRKKKNCFEKLVTQILTEQRKNINNLAFKTCGVTFTYQRAGEEITAANERRFRKKRRYYRWMVMGKFVSNFVIFHH